MKFLIFFAIVAIFAIPLGLIWSLVKIRELTKRIEVLEKQQGEQPVSTSPDIIAEPAIKTVSEEAPTKTTPVSRQKRGLPQVPKKPERVEKPAKETIESQLGSKWLVWVGGIALVFGGVFLVNYSIEHGLLGPWERIVAGLSLGLVLLGAGEWLRRQPTESKYTSAWPHMPIAVTAAGITTLFGSVYAGYALYDLFAPIVAFLALAVVAMAAVIIAILHGQLLALLGVAGAYVVPMLISSDDPSAPMLYSYLFLFCTASLALFRYKGWVKLGWANLVGSQVWVVLGIFAFAPTQMTTLSMGIYLLASLALFMTYGWDKTSKETVGSLLEQLRQTWSLPAHQVSLVSAIVISALSVLLVIDASHSMVALSVTACMTVGLLILARLNVNLLGLGGLSVLVPLAALASWSFPSEILEQTPRYLGANMPYGLQFNIVIPEGFELFQSLALASVCVHLIAGAVFTQTQRHVGFWAVLSVLSPVCFFVLSYWKINGMQTLPVWSLLALILGAIFTGLAYVMSRKSHVDVNKHGLATYIIGGFAALALAFGAGLESQWLSISIALLLPAMAWVNGKIPLLAIRWCAYPLIVFVLGQLILEGHLWAFFSDRYQVVDWYIYGYGLPALALAIAAYIFAKDRHDHLVSLLEAGALSCWITMLSSMVHDFAAQALNQSGYSFAEQTMQSTVWLLNALGIYWLNKRAPSVVRDYAWTFLAVAGFGQVIVLQLLMGNPWLYVRTPVGEWPILNWLFVGYVIPALFALIFAKLLKDDGETSWARYGAGLSFVLIFTFISMEIHHWFAGPILRGAAIQEAELYTYSVAWLVFAGLLMALAIRFKNADVQKGALAVLVLTVLKVFIYDMEQLEGLLRAVSFLGLGGSLIGIGYVYQRFMLKPAAKEE